GWPGGRRPAGAGAGCAGWRPAGAGAWRAGPGAGARGAGRAAAGAGGPGTVSTVPAPIRSGSGPTAVSLAAYRAGQPPRTPSAAAIADRVSPGRTVHVAAGRAARRAAVTSVIAAGAGALAGAARVLPATLVAVLLTAVRGLGWATRRPGPARPATAARGRMHQASTRHADMVHLRTMVLLPSWGQPRRQRPGAAGIGPGGRKGLGRRDLRQQRSP